ncbi:hypothetical protein [Rhizobium bangladeshense]|uniref:hypothetical protein n=1 Tax=Rhizobium bangladeshense TaxID=1138189 RepID=UPI0007E54596|nr:hypothetical protein [Rhizobium bangladeshense]
MQDDTRIRWGSLASVESLIGETFDHATARRLAGAPEDQLSAFLGEFAEAWYNWLENEGIKSRMIAGSPLYLPSAIDYDDRRNPLVMSLASYKRGALCFPTVAVPDPLAGALHGAIEAASLTGSFPLAKTRKAFRSGLLRLAEIAPLVRIGALSLVPNQFGGLHPIIQNHARHELKNVTDEDKQYWQQLIRKRFPAAEEREIEFGARQMSDEFALALAWVAATGAWPLTNTPHVFDRISSGFSKAETDGKALGIEVARAMTTFQLPDTSCIDIELLSKLRLNDENFADFRSQLELALIRAQSSAGDRPELFRSLLKDELTQAAEKCEIRGSLASAFDGIGVPALSSLTIAAVKIGFGDLNIADPNKLAIAAAEVAAPGIVWLLAEAIAAMSSKQRDARQTARVYGSLAAPL